MAAVFMVRMDPTAEASFAAIRDRSRLGIAIAAIIRMIATTINNSISEKPFCFLFMFLLSPREHSLRNLLCISPGWGTQFNLHGLYQAMQKCLWLWDRNYSPWIQ